MNVYPSRTVYSYNRGAAYPDNFSMGAEKYQYRPDHAVCIFMEDHEPDPLDVKEGWVAEQCNQFL